MRVIAPALAGNLAIIAGRDYANLNPGYRRLGLYPRAQAGSN
jgi:hypothetical protein